MKETENGMTAYRSTGSAVVDLFGAIGAMRNGDDSMERLIPLVDAAYAEDPLLTVRCLFYARDVRGGLGEREIFRKALYHLASKVPDAVRLNLTLIPEYGRWDDLFSLIGTPVEDNMWSFIKLQLEEDRAKLAKGQPVSLLAKWMPSAKTSSKDTMALARYACRKLGVSVYDYKRLIRDLRRAIGLLEQDMSAKRWNDIEYGKIPSQAHMRHTKAFHRNDEDRYCEYLDSVKRGESKINAGTLYPYEIVERLRHGHTEDIRDHNMALEEMWKALPDYTGNGGNVLVVADTSGSMMGRPMMTSTSLAMYFAERNKGPFANMYMTFSERPELIVLDPRMSLAERYEQMIRGPWMMNTDLDMVFGFLLYAARKIGAAQEDMPQSIVIITDMEIDRCTCEADRWDSIIDFESKRYQEAGYRLPDIVFWNVASRHNTYLERADRKGVQMVSGSSPSVFQGVMGFVGGMTPIEAMRQILGAERYKAINVP